MKNTANRVILNVPFRDKDRAKELGAWWDPDIKKWFVPANKDSSPFSEWLVEDESSAERTERNLG